MNQLSDLELVAQAMSTSGSTPEPASKSTPKTNGDTQSSNQPQPHPQDNKSSAQTTPPTSGNLPDLTPLNASIDPSTLTSLTSLMSLSDSELEGLNEGQIEDIMRQLEVADDVADDLEGKLDRLLATLGGVEEEIINGQEGVGSVDGKHGVEGEEK
ncbi:hypothetical protein I302_105285 [Kwoniella bestiolae CBS 10118]|uniref:Uncharacterized protein n=1 Tax=Kwoniella bestiolae CBS 10118 TaxID=1296100 RepID=A0A1B9FSP9_9TREE|nr:hypothetical protein I302_08573 [Kwoniella bestiolae CBS 10118]OCF21794.1 hypothetical protein I302_08573 [Kwoniella bestiolae CBS 10118]